MKKALLVAFFGFVFFFGFTLFLMEVYLMRIGDLSIKLGIFNNIIAFVIMVLSASAAVYYEERK